jgi:hypothetical protein
MDLRTARASLAVLSLCSGFVSSCGSSESPEHAGPGTSGSGPSAGDSGSGGAGVSAGTGGADASAGRAGSQGSSGDAGSSGAAGSAGTEAQCQPISTFETGVEPSVVLHVATTGRADGAGTEQDPFDGIETALGAAQPGTAIRVHAGDYPGDIFLSDVIGTEQAPIWIGGAPGEERPVIGGAGSAEALHVSGARYFVLHDLEIAGTTANGVNLDDRGDYADSEALRHVVVRNLSFHDVGTGGNNDCLKISGANDFFVLDSEFVDCSVGGSNIDHVGCHDGLIAGNSFEGGGTGVQAKGGSRGIEIRGNVFRQNGGRAVNMGGATGFEFFRPPLDAAGENYEARDVRVIANVFDRSAEVAAMPGCVDCLFAHNTVYRPTTRILRILQETTTSEGFTFLPASGGRVVNNVFSYTRAEITSGGRAINVGAGTSPATFSYTNNLWYASDDVAASDDVDYQDAMVSGTLAPADPAFTAPTNGDFTLLPSSPALAAGVALTEAPQDHNGQCYGSPPTVGAFEHEP